MNNKSKIQSPKSTMAALFAAIAAAGLISAAIAAPDKSNYWPMDLGNTWTGTAHVGKDMSMTQEITVTSVKKDGASSLATVDYKTNGRSVNTEVYRVTAKELTRESGGPNGGMKMNPPIPLLKYPLTAGKSWKWKGNVEVNGQPIQAESTFTVSGPLKVKTSAGTFQTMKVASALVMDPEGRKISMPNAYWFAPGVGMVKQTASVNGATIDVEITKYKVK